MKYVGLIAARLASSRFPGKALADLSGKPMIQRLTDRILFSSHVNKVVLATTNLKSDDKLIEWAKSNNIEFYRGSSSDVLGRIQAAVQFFKINNVVEVLGDNPLVHSDLIDAAVELHIKSNSDYVATLTNEYPQLNEDFKKFPIGIRVQVITSRALRRCESLAKKDYYREHATSFIAENPKLFKTEFVLAKGLFSNLNRPKLNFAVNRERHLELMRKIFTYGLSRDKNFSVNDAMDFINTNKNLINVMGEK